MNSKIFAINLLFVGIVLAAEDVSIVPEVEIPNVSTSQLRNNTTAKNPFFAKTYVIAARNEKNETASADQNTVNVSSRYVYMSEPDGKNVTIWEINQKDAKAGESDRFVIGQANTTNTKFIILKNGNKNNKSTYPHKLVIPASSKFVGAFFLDYLQHWIVESVNGDTVTVKAFPEAASRTISGKITISAEQTLQIKLNSNKVIDNNSVLSPATGDVIAIVIDSENREFKDDETNNLTLIKKVDSPDSPKLKYITGKIK